MWAARPKCISAMKASPAKETATLTMAAGPVASKSWRSLSPPANARKAWSWRVQHRHAVLVMAHRSVGHPGEAGSNPTKESASPGWPAFAGHDIYGFDVTRALMRRVQA